MWCFYGSGEYCDARLSAVTVIVSSDDGHEVLQEANNELQNFNFKFVWNNYDAQLCAVARSAFRVPYLHLKTIYKY